MRLTGPLWKRENPVSRESSLMADSSPEPFITEDHRQLVDRVKGFASRYLEPHLADEQEEDELAPLFLKLMASQQLLRYLIPRESAMAKLYATEAGQRIVDSALQIHGGEGLIKGSVMERLYREIRALRIYEGTSEIQHLIIADELLKQ